ncbi:MAG: tRNA uridine-5-carboxymethylaminomethyl(34) synthesis GTPase MnmE [Bacilli bacterium]|nr:tRNA uridine-5-carboxymethylaminomethyl(34) synthesis GTPase MnmE [Bacilli bacterium]
MNDTIAAISTSLGVGAISIIRVSGNDSIKIVNKLFKGDNLENVDSHTIHYGFIMDNDIKIDEVLVSIMKSPKTFTAEDVVEINCHGSIASTKKILELLLSNGCRLAEPGEFTKRAFLNGRIDLLEAEAVMDIINSKTEKSLSLAVNQLSGGVSNLIIDLRNDIIKTLANIEVNIDYPEYEDIEQVTINMLKDNVINIRKKITEILDKSKDGQIIKNGIKTVIIGKPNVGKSSLLNKLLDEEKAIVTDIAGTTRDIVEGTITIDGIVLNIIDTAGIRKTDDVVESIGVKKSISLIEDADLILFILNNNEKINNEDLEILEKIKNKNSIVLINKMDLESKINIDKIENNNIIKISALNNEGIDDLKNKIKELFNLEKIDQKDYNYLCNARSISLLKNCLDLLNNIDEGINNNVPIDMIEIDLKEVWNILGEIIGVNYYDELIDQLFSQFCLGK